MAVAVAINRPAQLIGVGCLVITALGWGLNWPATKVLAGAMPASHGAGHSRHRGQPGAGWHCGIAWRDAYRAASSLVAAGRLGIAQRQCLDGADDLVARLAQRG